jgi:GxxExxY protein
MKEREGKREEGEEGEEGEEEEEKEEKEGMMTENELARIVVDVCLRIHRKLGPGLLESAYAAVLAHELRKTGLSVERQVPLPLCWDGTLIDDCYSADMIIEDKLLLELKSVEKLNPVHMKQVITYLRVSGLKLGLLINFGAELIRDGIVRIVDGLEEEAPAV